MIILASKSGVRKDILDKHDVSCKVIPSNVDEDQVKDSLLMEGADPELISKNLAELKASRVSQKNYDVLVLGADSVIDLDGELIRAGYSVDRISNYTSIPLQKIEDARCGEGNCQDNGKRNDKKMMLRCDEVKQRAMTGKITHVDEEVESVNTEHATPSEVDISPTIPICQSTGLACTSDLIEKSLEEQAMLPDNVTADDVRLDEVKQLSLIHI